MAEVIWTIKAAEQVEQIGSSMEVVGMTAEPGTALHPAGKSGMLLAP